MSQTGANDVVYTWSVSSMDCYPTYENWTDVVFSVHWRLTGVKTVDGKMYSDSRYGSASVSTSTITTFVPYNELTLDMVVGWIYTEVNGDALKESIANSIQDQISPKIVSLPPPWASSM